MAQDKKPFKLIEIPLTKFKEEAVPFHRANYEKRRSHVQKLLTSDDEKINLPKEAREITTVIHQLKELACELITLKTEVQYDDLTKFKLKADPIYEDISDLICKYNGLQQLCVSRCAVMNEYQDEGVSKQDAFVDLQIQENLEDLKLEEHYNRLKNVQNLQEDIENVHGMFVDLHGMVEEQGIAVNTIESNVEEVQEDTKRGFREILKASKMNKASYPILGASFGAIAFGPVGAAVGIKAGLLAGATCAVFGYFTGRYMRKHNDSFIDSTAAAVENMPPMTDQRMLPDVASTSQEVEDKKHV